MRYVRKHLSQNYKMILIRAYKLYTDGHPFPHLKDCPQTIVAVVEHGLPELVKPPSMCNTLWNLVQDCVGTVQNPQPTMFELAQRLSEIHTGVENLG